MELSKEERAVIEGMRQGARVTVAFHGLSSVDEVDKKLALFDEDLFRAGNADLSEGKDKLVVFRKGTEDYKVEVTAFMRVGNYYEI